MIPESGLDVGWFLKLMKEWPKFVLFVYSFIKVNWKLLQYKFQWEKGNIFCKTHWRGRENKRKWERIISENSFLLRTLM